MIGLKKQMVKMKLSSHQHVMDKFHQLKKVEQLDAAAMKATQDAQLTKLLEHAYAHTGYYRKLFEKHGVMAGGKIRLDRFDRLPFLTKEIMRDEFEGLKSDDLASRSWYENTSGGSTGFQAKFLQDNVYKDWAQANKVLFDEWSGRGIGDKQIRLWGSVRDLLVGKETWRTQAGRWLRNEIWLNAYNMTADRISEYVNTINRFKPVHILSYVESIYELSRYIRQKGIRVHSPRGIMTTAGVLTPEMREMIESTFNTRVFNRYGSREVGDIACECDKHEGLHISEYTHYVEIVRDDGSLAEPGEIGHIAVTQLTNYAMPLIRYRIGDMGAMSEHRCSCGRPQRMLREVTGRESDTFYTPGGGKVHGTYFTQIFYPEQWIKQYQVVQEQIDEIEVKIVCEEGAVALNSRKDRLDAVKSSIKRAMGDTCRITFTFTDHIPATASGKYRYTISKVDPSKLAETGEDSREPVGIG
ncbi:phenylacetate--CoA ligase family protein [Paenibacillus tarimensis]|uniref:phenylacetate--CoA ligase family protein n=1 Tax=Paenibacillus tarimensis TaxID=416012 RepID=UPI001F429BB5|nr:hypothetical protein [Paenibacillus tarimensis]MCF2944974.1 hypothetical protein [Paenibacillus tarimensis]